MLLETGHGLADGVLTSEWTRRTERRPLWSLVMGEWATYSSKQHRYQGPPSPEKIKIKFESNWSKYFFFLFWTDLIGPKKEEKIFRPIRFEFDFDFLRAGRPLIPMLFAAVRSPLPISNNHNDPLSVLRVHSDVRTPPASP